MSERCSFPSTSTFSHFFKKNNKFPRFKSKNNPKQSYRLPQGFKINIKNKYISIPKLGWIKFRGKFNIPQDVEFRNITISKDCDKYFVLICYKTNEKPKEKEIPELDKTLGIDLGIKTLATFSDGTKIDNPKHLKQYENKLIKEQQKLSKKPNKDSKNYQKQKKIVNKTHKKVSNTRKDFLHKLTTSIVENQDYSSVVIEDLSVNNIIMQDNQSNISKAIGDVGLRIFRQMIEYKSEDKGKNLFVIGRFEPSSKLCVCGVKNNELTLNDRELVCSNCGVKHDRDILAANNIKTFGFRKYESGQGFVTIEEPPQL
jgi:putative transposase